MAKKILVAKQKATQETLKKGKMYKRSELKGHKCLFITINNGKYRNELHPDGVVHEQKDKEADKDITPIGKVKTNSAGRNIMVRHTANADNLFEFIGNEVCIVRYDQTRNKIIVGEKPKDTATRFS